MTYSLCVKKLTQFKLLREICVFCRKLTIDRKCRNKKTNYYTPSKYWNHCYNVKIINSNIVNTKNSFNIFIHFWFLRRLLILTNHLCLRFCDIKLTRFSENFRRFILWLLNYRCTSYVTKMFDNNLHETVLES